MDRVDDGVPGADVPEVTGALQGPTASEQPRTLGDMLVGIVDGARALATRFGIRPYRVFLVHGRWSGQRRGEGTFEVTSRREIVPVPVVRDMSSVRAALRATGTVEEGEIVVDEISPRIPEDDLRGKTPDLKDPANPKTAPRNAVFFWEVVENRPSRPAPAPRRFILVGAHLTKDGMSWRVTLKKQDRDSERSLWGDP